MKSPFFLGLLLLGCWIVRLVGAPMADRLPQLIDAWKSWCAASGRGYSGTIQTFGRDIHAAVPDLRVAYERHGGGRVRVYYGLTLVD